MIDLTDLAVIYLALGAPIGVYKFFLARDRRWHPANYLLSFFACVFWIPFAAALLHRKLVKSNNVDSIFDKLKPLDSSFEERLLYQRKQFEKILRGSDVSISLYQFRELYERYSGLTAAVNSCESDVGREAFESELLSVSGKKRAAASEICLRRRNRDRLTAHQQNARRQFGAFIEDLFRSGVDTQALSKTLGGLLSLIDDRDALSGPLGLRAAEQQNRPGDPVSTSENERWIHFGQERNGSQGSFVKRTVPATIKALND